MQWEEPLKSPQGEETGEHCLPTISLIHLPHPKIPNLYQCCFEYIEPWQWSPVTELVETGRWFFASKPEERWPSQDRGKPTP